MYVDFSFCRSANRCLQQQNAQSKGQAFESVTIIGGSNILEDGGLLDVIETDGTKGVCILLIWFFKQITR